MTERVPANLERPFAGSSVYYSGSVSGVSEADLRLPEQVVEYMEQGGAYVLDPFVAIPKSLKKEEWLGALAAAHSLTVEEWQGLAASEQARRVYELDISLVDEATHVVALLNG